MSASFSDKIAKGFIFLLYSVIAMFVLFPSFPGVREAIADNWRGEKRVTIATIDSVRIGHKDYRSAPTVTFYYHYNPLNNNDTVIYGQSEVDYHNPFSYTADELKAKYYPGWIITVYYKVKPPWGNSKVPRYSGEIYPRLSFFEWNRCMFSGFIEYLIALFAACFFILRISGKNPYNSIKAGGGIASVLFVAAWLLYSSSPQLQREVFRITHPGFAKVEAIVYDWEVKYKLSSGRRGRSNGYHYVSGKCYYKIEGKPYKSAIVPVKIYGGSVRKGTWYNEMEYFKKYHNPIAYVDRQNPEYAVLYVNNEPFYYYSSGFARFKWMFVFFGAILLIAIAVTAIGSVNRRIKRK